MYQQSYSGTCSTFGKVMFWFFCERSTGNIQMNEGVRGEELKEFGGCNGSGFSWSNVFNIGNIRFKQAAIFFPHRKLHHAFIGGFTAQF